MPIETPACDIGAKAPYFELPDLDGQLVSIDDFNESCGLVVAFICNHCPYVKAVISDFVKDADMLISEGIGVVAIMSNDFQSYPDDAPEKMREFAEKHKFSFPYLLDESQDIAKKFDAVCTPDFFGFGKEFILGYRGRLDNLRMERDSNRVPDLLNAMLEIKQTGACSKAQFPSAGCSVKWK